MSLLCQIAGLLREKLLNAKRLGKLTYKTAPGDWPTFVVYPQSGMPTFNVQAHPDGVVGSYAGLVRFALIRYGVPDLEQAIEMLLEARCQLQFGAYHMWQALTTLLQRRKRGRYRCRLVYGKDLAGQHGWEIYGDERDPRRVAHARSYFEVTWVGRPKKRVKYGPGALEAVFKLLEIDIPEGALSKV